MRLAPTWPRFIPYYLLCLVLCFQACEEREDPSEEAEEEAEEARFQIEGANTYELNLLKDPRTGKIPEGIHEQELEQARSILRRQLREGRGTTANIYTAQGPHNIGGRTRTVVYDVRYNGTTNQTILAGGVSGGVFKSIDDGGYWTRKSPTSAIYSVTSLAQDTRPGYEDTWYYGTGEVLGGNELTAAPMQGDGIFKSTDNGETWQKLPASNNGSYESFDRREDCIWRVAVNPINGDIYTAAAGGIFRSADGGASWTLVISGSGSSFNALQSTDVIISGSGRIYAAFDGFNSDDVDGIWTTTSGNPGTWTRIAGQGPGGMPAGWDAENTYGRIVLALAPGREELLYAMIRSNNTPCANEQAQLFRWNQLSANWTNLTQNLPGCGGGPGLYLQGGYNMALAVSPDNPQTIFIGGSTLYRSSDGFTTPTHTTEISGSDLNTSLHADVHCLAFKPFDAHTMICGSDGGLQRTNENEAPSVQWSSINNHYSTVQYYHVTLAPQSGSDKVIGGAQDNGTSRNIGGTGGAFELVYGGDGVSVGLSEVINGNMYEYGGYQYGNIFRRNAVWSMGSATDIRPASAGGLGLFVTLFHLDPDNTELLYYALDNRLFRNANASIAMPYNWTELTGAGTITDMSDDITALATTRGPYSPENSSLFIGNNDGRLFRLRDPAHVNPGTVPVDISGPDFPAFATISSIAVNPRNDDTVLVTYSNYGSWVTNIWWTGNAHSDHPTWVNVEHNLSLPSIRSSAIAVTGADVKYFVGTSVGLFQCTDVEHRNWEQEAPGQIGNAIISSLALRPCDNRLLVGTYGNAMWSASLSASASAALPITLLNFSGRLQGEETQLEWTTSSELNAAGFDVQRSFDGNNFQTIGQVAARGNSNTPTGYRFIDKAPAAGRNFYRLNMRDVDGHSRLSDIVIVHRDRRPQQLYVTNPFYSAIDLRFAERPEARISVQLFDLSGHELSSAVFERGQSLRFSPGLSLSKGLYLLRVESGKDQFTVKVIKQ